MLNFLVALLLITFGRHVLAQSSNDYEKLIKAAILNSNYNSVFSGCVFEYVAIAALLIFNFFSSLSRIKNFFCLANKKEKVNTDNK